MIFTANTATSTTPASISVSMSEQEANNLFGAIQALSGEMRTAFSNVLSVEELMGACAQLSPAAPAEPETEAQAEPEPTTAPAE
jgi:hypothetical protein